MIKILINNEEVVCKNNIKIDEKMLSTSSTILKNCYPLSWEDTKNYVSRFYFPKDYSKCKIIDKHEVTFEIIGSTAQDGTPTPDNPIPVINKTGTITETIGGKEYQFNLGEIELNTIDNYEDKIYKSNGKWYLHKEIGKITLDGSENWTNFVPVAASSGTMSQIDLPMQFINRNGYSDRFPVIPDYSATEHIVIAGGLGHLYVHINNDRLESLNIDGFKTWLSNNNTTFYYVLKNPPSDEEITNEILLEQLNSVGEDLLFCGVIKNTGKISLNPREPHYCDLQVLDFKLMLSEGETLNYVITGKTILEAIDQVIASISDYGFILGNVNIQNPDDMINAYSTLNKTAYDVFQYIADVTQSRWTTRMVDENTVAIDFIDPTLENKQTPINYTEEYFCDNEIVDMSFSYSTNDYRNKQIMTSDEVFGNIIQSETKIADGYTKTFNCDNKIGQITSITINGNEASFCTKAQQELGVVADFVYQPGESTFRSTNTINVGSLIIISYYPIVKGREIVINSNEINRINNNTGRKGTISRYENRNDTTSSQELIKIGQSYIKYKGSAEISLKIVSKKNLFNKCDVVDFNAPFEDLSTEYMVKNKSIDIYPTANKVFYTFELSSNFNSEDAINYFDNQRAKNQGNLEEGETISRAIDIENTALLYLYDTEIQEVQVSNPTSLDFALDGVLI